MPLVETTKPFSISSRKPGDGGKRVGEGQVSIHTSDVRNEGRTASYPERGPLNVRPPRPRCLIGITRPLHSQLWRSRLTWLEFQSVCGANWPDLGFHRDYLIHHWEDVGLSMAPLKRCLALTAWRQAPPAGRRFVYRAVLTSAEQYRPALEGQQRSREY